MFDELSSKLEGVFKKLKGQHRITESNVKEALREVRIALLEADVNYNVAKSFIKRVKEKAVGAEVISKVTPGQQIVKIIHDELIKILGEETKEITFNQNRETRIMMVGLQGSGKTTHSAKIANYLRKKYKKKPMMVAADIYRPAAIDQLVTLGKQISIPVYNDDNKDVLEIAKNSFKLREETKSNVMIFDTAGRLAIDDEMMKELERLKDFIEPDEILFVADSMIGQDAVSTAEEFCRRLNFDGVVLTKLDGDARGGAALSIKEVTGKPIKFIGIGEKVNALEMFHPDRLAQRILGMGDILSLVEKAQENIDEKEAERLANKIQKEDFTLEDFKAQIKQIKKIGSIKSILKMMPGMGGKINDLDIDEKAFVKIEAIINSMTMKEKLKPSILNGSRKLRIAKGCGRSVQEINNLLKQFNQMNQMMRQIRKIGFGKLAKGMFGGMPGGGKMPF